MSDHPTPRPRYRWWHAALVGIAANVASGLPAGYNGDENYYASLKTPPGSPPGWAFAPAWAINNVLTLWSNLRIANMPSDTQWRTRALRAEGASWIFFAVFSALYFGLRSPVLGAVDTAAGLATTAYSVAVTRRIDRRATLALIPRLLWLTLATYVSVVTAVRSADGFVGWRGTSAGARTTRATRRR